MKTQLYINDLGARTLNMRLWVRDVPSILLLTSAPGRFLWPGTEYWLSSAAATCLRWWDVGVKWQDTHLHHPHGFSHTGFLLDSHEQFCNSTGWEIPLPEGMEIEPLVVQVTCQLPFKEECLQAFLPPRGNRQLLWSRQTLRPRLRELLAAHNRVPDLGPLHKSIHFPFGQKKTQAKVVTCVLRNVGWAGHYTAGMQQQCHPSNSAVSFSQTQTLILRAHVLHRWQVTNHTYGIAMYPGILWPSSSYCEEESVRFKHLLLSDC